MLALFFSDWLDINWWACCEWWNKTTITILHASLFLMTGQVLTTSSCIHVWKVICSVFIITSTDTQESLFIFGKLFSHHAHTTTTTTKSVSRNLPNTDGKYSIVLCMGKYLAPLCRAWQVFLGLYMAFDGLYFIHVPFFLSHWISIS